ncbi:MAG: hypothetical protein ABI613_03150 [Gemmatimonadota bacterium]
MYSPTQRLASRHESPYAALQRWTGTAPERLLRVMLFACAAGVAGIILLQNDHFILASPMVTLGSVGGWGLLGREPRPSTGTRALGFILCLIGTLSLVIGGFALLMRVMGPAPVL